MAICIYCEREFKGECGIIVHLPKCDKGPKGDAAKLEYYNKKFNYSKEEFIQEFVKDKISIVKIARRVNKNYRVLEFYARQCGIIITHEEWTEYRRKRHAYNKHVNKIINLDKSAIKVTSSKTTLKKENNEIIEDLNSTPVENIGEEVVDKTSYLYSRDFIFKNIGELQPYILKKLLKDERYKKLSKIDSEIEMKIAQAYSRGLNDLQIKKFYPEVSLNAIKKIIDRCILYQEKENGK